MERNRTGRIALSLGDMPAARRARCQEPGIPVGPPPRAGRAWTGAEHHSVTRPLWSTMCRTATAKGQLWLTHSYVLILTEVYNPEGFKPPLKHTFLLPLWDKLVVKSCRWCRKESWGWKWKVKKANKKAHHRAISLPAGGSSSSPLPTNSSIYKRAFNCSSVSFLFIICIVLATFQNAEGCCLLSEELIQSLCNPETKLIKKRRKWCS